MRRPGSKGKPWGSSTPQMKKANPKIGLFHLFLWSGRDDSNILPLAPHLINYQSCIVQGSPAMSNDKNKIIKYQ
jgi:hypothetical protein